MPSNPYKTGDPSTTSLFADMTVIEVQMSCDVINSVGSDPISSLTWAYDEGAVEIPLNFFADPICPVGLTCETLDGPGEGDLCAMLSNLVQDGPAGFGPDVP